MYVGYGNQMQRSQPQKNKMANRAMWWALYLPLLMAVLMVLLGFVIDIVVSLVAGEWYFGLTAQWLLMVITDLDWGSLLLSMVSTDGLPSSYKAAGAILLGYLLFWLIMLIMGWIGTILGIVFGVRGLSQAKQCNGKGKKRSIVALSISIFSIVGVLIANLIP
jgi:hypothetical protein